MLGERIFQARKAQGRTRVWVASQARIATETLKLIESGQTENPGILHVLAIAGVLGLSLDALVHEEDKTYA